MADTNWLPSRIEQGSLEIGSVQVDLKEGVEQTASGHAKEKPSIGQRKNLTSVVTGDKITKGDTVIIGDAERLLVSEAKSEPTQECAKSKFQEIRDKANSMGASFKTHTGKVIDAVENFWGDSVAGYVGRNVLPKGIFTANIVLNIVDVTGISGIFTSAASSLTSVFFAAKDLRMHNKWTEKIDPEIKDKEAKFDKKGAEKDFENFTKVLTNISDPAERNRLLQQWGMPTVEVPPESPGTNPAVEARNAFTATLGDKKTINMMKSQYVAKRENMQETENRVKASQEAFRDGTAALTHRVENVIYQNRDNIEQLKSSLQSMGIPAEVLKGFSSAADIRADMKTAGSTINKSIVDVVRHREEVRATSVDKLLITNVKKIHGLHKKLITFDLVKSVTEAVPAITGSIIKAALKTGIVAGSVTAPAVAIASIPLTVIPIAVKCVGEGIRFGLVAMYRPNSAKATLKATSLRRDMRLTELFVRKLSIQLDGVSLKKQEARIEKLSKMQVEPTKAGKADKIAKKLTITEAKAEKIRTKILRKNAQASHAKQRVEDLNNKLIEAGVTDAENYLGLKDPQLAHSYMNRLGRVLVEQYKNGTLEPSTDKFLKKHMGIDMAKLCSRNPGNEVNVITKEVKRFFARDEKQIMSFIRRQLKAERRAAEAA